jgi:hypothetical protein
MFHKYATESSKYIGAGIYTGGLREAKMLIENNEAPPTDFKFIFNSVEWGPDQLENEVKAGSIRIYSYSTCKPHLTEYLTEYYCYAHPFFSTSQQIISQSHPQSYIDFSYNNINKSSYLYRYSNR